MFGISKNQKHSYHDFGLKVFSRKIGVPRKKRITVSVPYSNKTFDFSSIYGVKTYEERELEYSFVLFEEDTSLRSAKINGIVKWLETGNTKVELRDDFIENYHFMAECSEIDIEETEYRVDISVRFIADPYKISNDPNAANLGDVIL